MDKSTVELPPRIVGIYGYDTHSMDAAIEKLIAGLLGDRWSITKVTINAK